MDTLLLLLGGVTFGVGVVLLVGSPMLAGTVAERTTRPELARRASGPDRMRGLIVSQQAARSRRATLAKRLRVIGATLAVAGSLGFVAGVALRTVPG